MVAKSTVSMPKPTPPSKGPGGSGPNLAALSPIKVDNMTSMEALKLEFSLVQSAIKNGHKDANTAQRGKQVCTSLCGTDYDVILYLVPALLPHTLKMWVLVLFRRSTLVCR